MGLRYVGLALVLGILARAARAQATDEGISLTEVIRRAVETNPELRRERVRVFTAEANELAARGPFDVVINAALNFTRSVNPISDSITTGFDNTWDLNLSASRALESGGTLAFSAEETRVNTTQGIQACFSGECTYYFNTWSLAFSHPLLRNFGTEVTLAALRKTRILRDQALLSRQLRAGTVVRDVVTAYWELAYATQDLSIRRQAVELAREQLRITRAQIDVGRLSPVESAAVERAINDRLQDVVTAEETLSFRSWDLRRLLGVPVAPGQATFLALEQPATNGTVVGLPDAAAEVERAVANNPQLKLLRLGVPLSEEDIKTARSAVKPALNVFGQVGTKGAGVTLGTALSGATGFDNLVASAGLSFQAAVQNRSARGQLEAALQAREGAMMDAASLELDIRDAVMRRVLDVQAASKRLDYATAAIGFAQKNLDAEQARFSVGRSTNNDVLLRQQELKTNQLQAVRATVDGLISEAALDALTGDALERHGLVLKGL